MSKQGSPELLDKQIILESIDSDLRGKINSLSIEQSLDSTNSAIQRLPVAEQHAAVMLAEQQTRGRGRRGRQWHSPFARNLYLSLGWTFEKPLSELGCLPLVVALSSARALSRAGLNGHKIKWPNDILLEGQKLCGCLVEMQVDSKGYCRAILGVGINIHMQKSAADSEIDQPWTDLSSQLPACSRNAIAAMLLEELIRDLDKFSSQGFAPFDSFWKQMDGLHGQSIEVFAGEQSHKGIAVGIDANGALLLDTGSEILSLHSGEVSLHKTRPVL